MICSSLKRLLRTTSSSLALSGPSYMEKSHFRWTNFWGAGQEQVGLGSGAVFEKTHHLFTVTANVSGTRENRKIEPDSFVVLVAERAH